MNGGGACRSSGLMGNKWVGLLIPGTAPGSTRDPWDWPLATVAKATLSRKMRCLKWESVSHSRGGRRVWHFVTYPKSSRETRMSFSIPIIYSRALKSRTMKYSFHISQLSWYTFNFSYFLFGVIGGWRTACRGSSAPTGTTRYCSGATSLCSPSYIIQIHTLRWIPIKWVK